MTEIKPGDKQTGTETFVVCLTQASACWRNGRYDQLNNFIKCHIVTLGQNQK